jgi:transcriptional regulator with XRE-family HTH domain
MKPNIIGNRIQYFRKRSGLSQFELEMEIDASPGSLSRIEHGITNPSKETIHKIAKVLGLVHLEIAYMEGDFSEPPTENEVKEATDTVKDYFSKPETIAYMVDEHFRYIDASPTIKRLFGISDKQFKDQFLHTSLLEIVLNPVYGIVDSIDTELYEDVVYNLIERYYHTSGFMIDTLGYKENMKILDRYPLGLECWEKAKESTLSYNFAEKRSVTFVLNGEMIPFIYSNESLIRQPRFDIIEYFTDSNILKMILERIYK